MTVPSSDPPIDPDPERAALHNLSRYTVVVPTIGRTGLRRLLAAVDHSTGPRPDEVIVVDDRPADARGLPLGIPTTGLPLRMVNSGGRGPAAARNVGWLSAHTDWVVFLDDDVVVTEDWSQRLVEDLARCGPDDAGCTAVIEVPSPFGRAPTDAERGTLGLAGSRWITADIAYRRAVLSELGGFDETFPRAYREDSDLALRVQEAGYRIAAGRRRTTHPLPADAGWAESLRRQRGNADDAVMAARHGRDWRRRAGAGPGRIGWHAATTASAATALIAVLSGHRRLAAVGAAAWAGLTTDFTLRRILPGPRTGSEIARMIVTSILIPPAACYHRLRGEWAVRFGDAARPAYVTPRRSRDAAELGHAGHAQTGPDEHGPDEHGPDHRGAAHIGADDHTRVRRSGLLRTGLLHAGQPGRRGRRRR